MFMKPSHWIATLLISSTAAFAAAADDSSTSVAPLPQVQKLKDVRGQLHAPAYTGQERQLVADQAYMMISNMYVHRDLKLKDFGPSADAVNRLKDIQKKASTMKDDDFHTAMQLIFRDLHDNHTNYNAPLPLRCSYIISPMMFKDVVDNGKLKVVFERLTRISAKTPGAHQNAKPLDELVAVDGMPIVQYAQKVIFPESMGANNSAQMVYGLMNHTIRSLSSLPVPANDSMTYTLKSATNNATYDIKVDLLAIVNEPNCAKEVKSESADEMLPRKKKFLSVGDTENPTVKVWKRLAAPEDVSPFDNDPLSEIGSIADITTPAGKLTILRISSFMPTSTSVESLVHRVKEVLVDRRDTSAGLIIDIRQNGGGSIKLAEELTQIFTPAVVQTMPVRMLPNDLNMNVFLKSNGGAQNGWTQDILTAVRARAPFSQPRVLTTPREANRFGQVWFKPVIVLTDAACYSACDLFAASMQDNGAAAIIGTHPSTGAGGANVMEYRNFRAVFSDMGSSNPFKSLPDGQSMRVSWRQTIRVGKNAGQLIEDRGVIPDVVIHYTSADLMAGGESRALMQSVARELVKLLPRYKSSIKLASPVRMKNGDAAQWSEQVVGVDTLDVMRAGKVVQSFRVSSAGERLNIQLPDVGNLESKRYDLVGKLNGAISFRVVREIFWRGDEVVVTGQGLQEDFRAQPKFLKTFVGQGAATDKWQISGGVLRVGQGPKYNPSIVTEAFLPLDLTQLTQSAMFYFNAAIQTEDGMDTLSLIARDTQTGEETYVTTLDGTLDMQQKVMAYQIPANKKHIEMVLEFESDENWNMTGPIVRVVGVKVGNPQQPTNNIVKSSRPSIR